MRFRLLCRSCLKPRPWRSQPSCRGSATSRINTASSTSLFSRSMIRALASLGRWFEFMNLVVNCRSHSLDAKYFKNSYYIRKWYFRRIWTLSLSNSHGIASRSANSGSLRSIQPLRLASLGMGTAEDATPHGLLLV